VYRNTSVYQPIAILLAQQPPLSKTLSVENSSVHPITLANGFDAAPGDTLNTFAVDPDLRVGHAHNWQVLVQRDLPASLTIMATYLGTKGSRLLQELLPNTVPSGAANPCPACPLGFIYLTSNGHSNKQTGQLQLRRRLRSGLTATVQYALSKATDNAGAFTGVRLDGGAIAQDWQHPEAEEGTSTFDQRHLVTAQLQYTTGAGVRGRGMLDGVRGKLFNGWTVTSQLTAGSGLPLTPVYLTSVAGTGVTGTIRPDVVPAPAGSLPEGFYVNPSAYAPPAPGRWGNAKRNSITGPRQFSFDAGVGRSFLRGDRLTFDWRINANNLLNRVTYANVNTIVGSPQFGLPTLANPMRKLQSSLRVRF
jgi:trimeric autotransporter adhesin